MRVAWLAIGFLLCAAPAGAETLYRLPWPDGMSFTFTQVPGGRITTHFTKATLLAVDIAMPVGAAVVAAREGMVDALEARHGASEDEDLLTYEGNFVRIRHADDTRATYAHLQHRGVTVKVGERVAAGQLIGYAGATGDVERPHLHFAVTRLQKNSAGWDEEISLPIVFYIGKPAVAFPPQAALEATANYSGPAEAPRMPSERRLLPWKHPVLADDEEARGWITLALWVACALGGLAWFWKFSIS
jgi:murein DD-endopeptidase MepM/ murein hydrolase activator NlpD